MGIKLKDEFKIINNSVIGMPERIQETEIEVSENDKNGIIQLIKDASNFNFFNANPTIDISAQQLEIINFKYLEFYSREIFKEIDNYPTRIKLTIKERSNVLKYQRIEE